MTKLKYSWDWMDCFKYHWWWNFNLWETEDKKDWWLNIAVDHVNVFEILYTMNWYRVIQLFVAHANNKPEVNMNVLWSIIKSLFIPSNAYVYDEMLHNFIHISIQVTPHPASKINKNCLFDIFLKSLISPDLQPNIRTEAYLGKAECHLLCHTLHRSGQVDPATCYWFSFV